MAIPDRTRSTAPTDIRPAHPPARQKHVVELYETTEFLVDTVCDFVAPNLHDGGAAIIVASAAHRAAFETALRDAGVDVEHAIAADRYIGFDAAELLDDLMVDGTPHAGRFREAIGEVIEPRRRQAAPCPRLRRDGRAAVGGRQHPGRRGARGSLERARRDARVRAAVRLPAERLQRRRDRGRVRARLRAALHRDPLRELHVARQRRRQAPRGRAPAARERRPARRRAPPARRACGDRPPAPHRRAVRGDDAHDRRGARRARRRGTPDLHERRGRADARLDRGGAARPSGRGASSTAAARTAPSRRRSTARWRPSSASTARCARARTRSCAATGASCPSCARPRRSPVAGSSSPSATSPRRSRRAGAPSASSRRSPGSAACARRSRRTVSCCTPSRSCRCAAVPRARSCCCGWSAARARSCPPAPSCPPPRSSA